MINDYEFSSTSIEYRYCQWYYFVTGDAQRRVIIISTRDKLDDRIRKTPTPNDVSYEDFVLFLKHNGFSEQTNNSSHYVYGCKKDTQTYLLSFARPHGASNFMKRAYITKAIEIIDEMNS